MVKSHNLIRKPQQFKVVSLFLHQYPPIPCTQNSMFQTFVVLSVKTKMESMKKLWFEIQ